jgi:hypothetical protein
MPTLIIPNAKSIWAIFWFRFMSGQLAAAAWG